MRIPLVSPIDSRDGSDDKDALLRNVLGEMEEGGPIAAVRPGLEVAATSTGNGNGLVCFNGELVSIFGAELGAGIEEGGEEYPGIFYIDFDGDVVDSAGGATVDLTFADLSFPVGGPCYAQSALFGTASTNYIAFPAMPAEVQVGLGDFTIEFLVNIPRDLDGEEVLAPFRMVQSGGEFDVTIQIESDGGNKIGAFVNNTGSYSSILLTPDTWHHVAFERVDGLATLYVDGATGAQTGLGSENFPSGVAYNATISVAFGDEVSTGGLLSSFGICDFARYQGEFTFACLSTAPSIETISPVANTKYDFCQSTL